MYLLLFFFVWLQATKDTHVGTPVSAGEHAGGRSNIASGTGSHSGLHLQPGGRAELQTSAHLPSESALTTGTQERVGVPGVLTEANRITGETSSTQRQL